MKKLASTFQYLYMVAVLSAQTIDRVEPPNWWIGMQHTQVQLMIYGEQIQDLELEMRYPGVKISGLVTPPNRNYLFVDLVISPKARPGTVLLQFFKGRTLLETYPWELLARNGDSAARKGVTTEDVIYLITPDRFANGDPGNDSVEGMKEKADRSNHRGRHGGDLRGVVEHLEYISEMGFTAIWLNPVLENNMPESSYHGYATTDYYRVDPRFGTNADFRNLVKESSRLGIKHVMDVIPNHCGLQHWWMSDLPYPDWIHQWNQFTQTNHRKTAPGDPHVSAYDMRVFSDGWFVRTMPDLNQRNPQMATYLIQNAIWWIEFTGLSGLRVDTYSYGDPDFMSAYCKRILTEYPALFIVGEHWHTVPSIVAYWQEGVTNKNGYVSHLPSPMDFPLQVALSASLNTHEGWNDPWVPLYETLAQDFLYATPNNLMTFTDNHDMSRIFTQVGEDYDLYRLAMACLLTMRGIPQIFYGTEILMSHPGTDDHVIIRSDFPGGWRGDWLNGFTGANLGKGQLNAQAFLKKLLAWRKSTPVIHDGNLKHFAPKDKVYVYFRYDDSKTIMVILNKNKGPYTLALGPYAEMLEGKKRGRDILTGTVYDLIEGIALPDIGPYILELE